MSPMVAWLLRIPVAWGLTLPGSLAGPVDPTFTQATEAAATNSGTASAPTAVVAASAPGSSLGTAAAPGSSAGTAAAGATDPKTASVPILFERVES